MTMSLIFDSTLASLVFFGCEIAAVNQSAIEMSMASDAQECVVVETYQDNGALQRRHIDSACVVVRDDYADKSQVDNGLIGQNDQGASLGGVFTGVSVGGSAIAPPQPSYEGPTIELVASPSIVQPGETTELQWNGDNIDRCFADGGWSGQRDIAGTESTGVLQMDTSFVLTCEGPDGTTMSSVMVTVFDSNPPPTVELTASPMDISSGMSSTLSWIVTNADDCRASQSWSGSRPLSGSESTGALTDTSLYSLTCNGPGGTAGDSVVVSVDGAPPPPAIFSRVTIEEDQAPWGKNLADLNGDGELDIVTGGGLIGSNVYWYRAPTWQKFQIGSVGGGDDLQAGDINGDGAIDVVVNRDPISWYENPLGSGGNAEDPWTVHPIANYRSHDTEIVDMNDDGKADIVIRIAGATFGTTRVFLQGATPQDWTTVSLSNDSNGTGGLAVADIDDDGRPDVVGDGYWLRQPVQNITDGGAWARYSIGSWPAGSSIDTADLNGDGNLDVTLAVSEVGVGEIAWFEAPDNPLTQSWTRHVIGSVEDVHRHHLVDMNNDGQLDIVFAEMYQSGTDRVGIYNNDGNAESWTLQILETHASHNLAVGDIGNDGDMDILGANWQLVAPAGGDIFLWINQTN